MADRAGRVNFIRETNEGAQRNGPNKDLGGLSVLGCRPFN